MAKRSKVKVVRSGKVLELTVDKYMCNYEGMTQYEIYVKNKPVAIAKKFRDEDEYHFYYTGKTSNGDVVDMKINGCQRVNAIVNRVADIYINGFLESDYNPI